jgi:hypothetical protein
MHASGNRPADYTVPQCLGQTCTGIIYIREVPYILHLSCVVLDRIPVMSKNRNTRKLLEHGSKDKIVLEEKKWVKISKAGQGIRRGGATLSHQQGWWLRSATPSSESQYEPIPPSLSIPHTSLFPSSFSLSYLVGDPVVYQHYQISILYSKNKTGKKSSAFKEAMWLH